MTPAKPDPYQPCPCGSGRKYKFCCRIKEQQLSNESPLVLVQKSAQYPLSQCTITRHWQQNGLGSVFVVRQLPNSKFLFGVYLVDLLCLGVKNTFFNVNIGPDAIHSMLTLQEMPIDPINYEDARSIILGSIEFARKHGFEPHPDWNHTRHLVEPDRPFKHKFAFGQKGKPIYIQGPDDDFVAITSMLKRK